MDRYVSARIRADLAQKLVFLTGPRQVGKTVLALGLVAETSKGSARHLSGRRDQRSSATCVSGSSRVASAERQLIPG